MIKRSLLILISIVMISWPKINFGQVPDLGAASGFALFTAAGAFNNSGATTLVTGDVGNNTGAFNAFPPGILVGQIHMADPVTAQAAADVGAAYSFLSGLTCDSVLGTTLGNNQVLSPNTYCIGAASTINGNLILDGQGDSNAVFVFQVNGALSTGILSHVLLVGGASLCNVFWQVNGAVSLGDSSVFRGTIVANGAIELLEGASLEGRGLSEEGAISLHTNIVTIATQPVASVIAANGPTTFCTGDSVILSGNNGGVWSNGATTPSITVRTGGDYFETNTNGCGSVTSNHIVVTVNPLPVCTITGNSGICQGQSTQLCAPIGTGYTYVWNNGSTLRCITVTGAGTFSVTVSNNGCSATCSKTITVTSPPSCSITGGISLCQGQSTQLCAPSGTGYTYLWNTGSTSRCITVSSAGTFTVTVSNNGCAATCSKTITVTSPPSCSITGGISLCQGQSTQLCAPSGTGYTYLWNTGSTSRCITASSAGTFTVTVTRSGCTSTCSKTVTLTAPPSCVITATTIVCQGQSTQLCASSGTGYTYLWNTGSTSRCITVSGGGTYTVTVSLNGCSSTCSKTIILTAPPTCTISGSNILCQGQSTQLCAASGSGYIYLWSNGSTSRCITVSSAGTFSVTVTQNGLSSICSKTVIVNVRPSCSISGNLHPVQGQSTSLCAPLGYAAYHWNTGATTRCIVVSCAGTYIVTVTNSGGCAATCSACVTYSCYREESTTNTVAASESKIEVSAYPNPFYSNAIIEFVNTGSDSHVLIELYTMTGNKITTLFNRNVERGVVYKAGINAEDLIEGIYIYRIVNGSQVINGKLTLIK